MRDRLITTTRLLAVVFLVLVAGAALTPVSRASPVHQEALDSRGGNQVLPDWMPEESAATLAIGIDVLVPQNLPSPFSGVPQILAGSGYYSLYWYVAADAPTLLQINGTARGEVRA